MTQQYQDVENYPVGTLLVRRELPYVIVNPNKHFVIVEVVDRGADKHYPTRYSYTLLRSDGQIMSGTRYLPDIEFNYIKVKTEKSEE